MYRPKGRPRTRQQTKLVPCHNTKFVILECIYWQVRWNVRWLTYWPHFVTHNVTDMRDSHFDFVVAVSRTRSEECRHVTVPSCDGLRSNQPRVACQPPVRPSRFRPSAQYFLFRCSSSADRHWNKAHTRFRWEEGCGGKVRWRGIKQGENAGNKWRPMDEGNINSTWKAFLDYFRHIIGLLRDF